MALRIFGAMWPAADRRSNCHLSPIRSPRLRGAICQLRVAAAVNSSMAASLIGHFGTNPSSKPFSCSVGLLGTWTHTQGGPGLLRCNVASAILTAPGL